MDQGEQETREQGVKGISSPGFWQGQERIENESGAEGLHINFPTQTITE